ncbi:hypothetical protein RHMOL_Rhmol07G0040700 [Rhododendron molle]|uniref:Uncharacterized protein n=1 Tax=Rhododendron molle TaxID=49168 RepID=A0ACC0MWN2_RHOML|nr:hypothetical protein RHMOL_Rhmol07G0040700 [Rhododendron molle]
MVAKSCDKAVGRFSGKWMCGRKMWLMFSGSDSRTEIWVCSGGPVVGMKGGGDVVVVGKLLGEFHQWD